jgi:hypothetical protein
MNLALFNIQWESLIAKDLKTIHMITILLGDWNFQK